jgi:hypothetical protein
MDDSAKFGVRFDRHSVFSVRQPGRSHLRKGTEWIDESDQRIARGLAGPWIGWYEAVEVEPLLSEATDLIR